MGDRERVDTYHNGYIPVRLVGLGNHDQIEQMRKELYFCAVRIAAYDQSTLAVAASRCLDLVDNSRKFLFTEL